MGEESKGDNIGGRGGCNKGVIWDDWRRRNKAREVLTLIITKGLEVDITFMKPIYWEPFFNYITYFSGVMICIEL